MRSRSPDLEALALDQIVVPAGEGRGLTIADGTVIEIVDLDGGQVGDLWAFSADDPGELLSASHTRAALSRLFPAPGEAFVSNRRRPILTLLEDTSPGRHDMLIAACDAERYRSLGVEERHANCAENLVTACDALGILPQGVPQPVNVFMDTPVLPDGRIDWRPAATSAGDRIVLRAERDLHLVLSACPQDLVDINTGGPSPLGIRRIEQP